MRRCGKARRERNARAVGMAREEAAVMNRLLPTLGALAIVCISSSGVMALDLRPGVPEGNVEVYLNVLVSSALNPANDFAFIDLAPFNDGTGRLAVSTIQGGVRVLDANGRMLSTSLLTKAQTGLVLPQEAGLTGIAFHPDFNHVGTFGYGKFYTITTEASESSGGLGNFSVDYPFIPTTGTAVEEHQDVIREWDLANFGSVPGNAANNQFTGLSNASSREVLRVDQPGPFHNVVDLAFNPTAQPGGADYGILYITAGDGGNRTGYDRTASAQNLGTIFGSVLRIDPNPAGQALVRTSAHSGQPAYSIPADNPYNGDDAQETKTSPTLAEIWAHGFRSPWRMNFDRQTGKMYIGDVGENLWEEIDLVEKGKNYGWGYMEGTHDGTLVAGDGTLVPGLTLPIIELGHLDAAVPVNQRGSDSIDGGFVYRGTAIPQLTGRYIFADLGQNWDSSAIFYAIVDPNDPDGSVGSVFEFKLSGVSPKFESGTQALPERIFSVGEDLNGEIYFIAGPDPRQPFDPNRPSLIIRMSPKVLPGDLNGDTQVNGIDWNAFKSGQSSNFAGLSSLETYAQGDLDGDFDHDLSDFLLFRLYYDQANGTGAFDSLLSVPEPSGIWLAALATTFVVALSRFLRVRKVHY
jgi:glucose/arabinose dehydrogenase